MYLDSREAEKVCFRCNLTQFFSKQQSNRFSQARLAQKTIFARITKSFVAEMTPPQKLSKTRLAKRIASRSRCVSPFPGLPQAREKWLDVAWKSFVSGLFRCYAALAASTGLFPASERKIYSSGKRSDIRQTTGAALKETFFLLLFPPLSDLCDLCARISERCARKWLKKGRISRPSQGYLLLGERFQHNAREESHENDARSIPYLEPAPSVDFRN
jgi:hypothetical protein